MKSEHQNGKTEPAYRPGSASIAGEANITLIPRNSELLGPIISLHI